MVDPYRFLVGEKQNKTPTEGIAPLRSSAGVFEQVAHAYFCFAMPMPVFA